MRVARVSTGDAGCHAGEVAAQPGWPQLLVRQSPTAATAGLLTCELGRQSSMATGQQPPRLLEARNQTTAGVPGAPLPLLPYDFLQLT